MSTSPRLRYRLTDPSTSSRKKSPRQKARKTWSDFSPRFTRSARSFRDYKTTTSEPDETKYSPHLPGKRITPNESRLHSEPTQSREQDAKRFGKIGRHFSSDESNTKKSFCRKTVSNHLHQKGNASHKATSYNKECIYSIEKCNGSTFERSETECASSSLLQRPVSKWPPTRKLISENKADMTLGDTLSVSPHILRKTQSRLAGLRQNFRNKLVWARNSIALGTTDIGRPDLGGEMNRDSYREGSGHASFLEPPLRNCEEPQELSTSLLNNWSSTQDLSSGTLARKRCSTDSCSNCYTLGSSSLQRSALNLSSTEVAQSFSAKMSFSSGAHNFEPICSPADDISQYFAEQDIANKLLAGASNGEVSPTLVENERCFNAQPDDKSKSLVSTPRNSLGCTKCGQRQISPNNLQTPATSFGLSSVPSSPRYDSLTSSYSCKIPSCICDMQCVHLVSLCPSGVRTPTTRDNSCEKPHLAASTMPPATTARQKRRSRLFPQITYDHSSATLDAAVDVPKRSGTVRHYRSKSPKLSDAGSRIFKFPSSISSKNPATIDPHTLTKPSAAGAHDGVSQQKSPSPPAPLQLAKIKDQFKIPELSISIDESVPSKSSGPNETPDHFLFRSQPSLGSCSGRAAWICPNCSSETDVDAMTASTEDLEDAQGSPCAGSASPCSPVSPMSSQINANPTAEPHVTHWKPAASLYGRSSRFDLRKLRTARQSSATTTDIGLSWIPIKEAGIWRHVDGHDVEIGVTRLQCLSFAERVALKQIALAWLHSMQLGCHVAKPKDPLTDKTKRSKYVKKKSHTVGTIPVLTGEDGPLHSKKLKKGVAAGTVFGVTIPECLANEQRTRIKAKSAPVEIQTEADSKCKSLDIVKGAESGTLNESLECWTEDPELKLNPDDDQSEPQTADKDLMSCNATKDTELDDVDSIQSHEESSPPVTVGDNQPMSSQSQVTSMPDHTRSMAVPLFVRNCCSYLEKYGLDTVGLFRVAGSVKRCRELRAQIDTGQRILMQSEEVPDEEPEYNPHDIATLLKEYFRDLPDPLLTKELYAPFVAVSS